MLYIKVTLCVTDCFSQHKIKSICINVKLWRIKPSRFFSMVDNEWFVLFESLQVTWICWLQTISTFNVGRNYPTVLFFTAMRTLKQFSPGVMLIDFNESRKGRHRERERDREKHQCERETPICCLPYVPRLGIKPTTFWCTGQCSHLLSHLGSAPCTLNTNRCPRELWADLDFFTITNDEKSTDDTKNGRPCQWSDDMTHWFL